MKTPPPGARPRRPKITDNPCTGLRLLADISYDDRARRSRLRVHDRQRHRVQSATQFTAWKKPARKRRAFYGDTKGRASASAARRGGPCYGFVFSPGRKALLNDERPELLERTGDAACAGPGLDLPDSLAVTVKSLPTSSRVWSDSRRCRSACAAPSPRAG